MAAKLKTCPVCGAEMASSAKVCPKCGARNKKPIYKRWWFYLILGIIILGAVAGGSGGSKSGTAVPSDTTASTATNTSSNEAEAVPVSYTHYVVTDMLDMLASNAMKAESTFKGQYVEIEGYLGTIDSNGKYIGVGTGSGDFAHFREVMCYLKTDDQRGQIMEMDRDDAITVRGKITDVGELLGFVMDIDSIN